MTFRIIPLSLFNLFTSLMWSEMYTNLELDYITDLKEDVKHPGRKLDQTERILCHPTGAFLNLFHFNIFFLSTAGWLSLQS